MADSQVPWSTQGCGARLEYPESAFHRVAGVTLRASGPVAFGVAGPLHQMREGTSWVSSVSCSSLPLPPRESPLCPCPAFAVTALDRQIDPTMRKKEDAHNVAVGASGSAGVEYGIVKQLRAFAEVQSNLMYSSFEFSDRTITSRLLNVYGLVGVRFAF
jgi:hypothetical protein